MFHQKDRFMVMHLSTKRLGNNIQGKMCGKNLLYQSRIQNINHRRILEQSTTAM